MPRGEGADECDQEGRLLAPFSDGQGVGQQGTFVKGLHADDIRHNSYAASTWFNRDTIPIISDAWSFVKIPEMPRSLRSVKGLS